MSENTNAAVETDETAETASFPNITPYHAAEVASRVLGTKVEPNTLYGLAKSGTVASNYDQWVRDGSKKSGYKVEFDGEAFAEYLRGRQSGHIVARGGKVNYASLVEQFNAEAPEQTETVMGASEPPEAE
jgi:hypothetical protein